MNFLDKEKRDVFEIFIQLGAMMAVVWEYRAKLFGAVANAGRDAGARRFLFNIMIAFVPAGIMAKLFGEQIKAVLFKPVPVALAFIIGGIVILWAERRQHVATVQSVDDMTWKDALKVGFCQCFALIPGTSRSGSTIIGGLFFGLQRKVATEFSFFLGIPTLGIASLYSMYKHRDLLTRDDIGVFAVGFISSFIFAFIAVRALIRYVARHDFTIFAWYRIAFGLIVLITAYSGVVKWTV